MADSMVADPNSEFDGLQIPPLDDSFFSDGLTFSPGNFFSFGDNDDVLDLDFTFDDINLPSDTEDFLKSTVSDSIPLGIPSDPEFHPVSDDPSFKADGYFNLPSSNSGDKSSDVTKVSDEAVYLNISSSDSPDCSRESGNKQLDVSRVLNCASPELEGQKREFSTPTSSQGSDNCANSVISPNSGTNSINLVVDQTITSEDSSENKNYLLKRKKENEDVNSGSTRTIKYRKPNAAATDQSIINEMKDDDDDDDKKKARLIRNRESAQLSRQRKKHYVEELEDKVRAMHSTIQDLSAKISYFAAENATLKQQMNGGGAVGPPPMPGMYPHPPMAPMGYPWMPYPPYAVQPQGSQVPLVPIPRLKPKQQQSKVNKKGDSKKTEGKSKTKKVASVSFLGLLFLMLLFGGLVPMVNVKYGGMGDAFLGRSDYIGNRFYDQHHGSRVLMVDGTNHNSGTRVPNKNYEPWKSYNNTIHCGGVHGGAESNIKQPSSEEYVCSGNASEPLVASLYVPRNDKLVKIDGNLIIHSVLASEKAMSSHEVGDTKSGKEETSLAVAFNLGLGVSVPGLGQNNGRHSHLYRSTAEQQMALDSGSAGKDNLKSTPVDGKLQQQWFREGLAGPMLSSGMCTEVFQFDVSPGAIIPATSVRNMSAEESQSQNSTNLNKGRNRRILHDLSIPLEGSEYNISRKGAGSNSHKEKSQANSSVSPMVVSVLVDPREVGDAEGDGIMGTKSLSRIFVVVLLDSVKYVTYSCMLPFKGSGHLVTA